MGWQAASRRTPIGIEAGSRSIRAMQLRRTSGGWRVEAAASMPRADAAAPLCVEDTTRLADVLSRAGCRGRDVVLAVPGKDLLTSVLALPPNTPAGSIPEIARDQLAGAHKCEPGSIEVACWQVPGPTRAGEATWALAVGCRIEETHALIDLFEAAGMIVRSLDVQAWAAVRACDPHLAGASRLAAILNVGWTAVHLVILCTGVVVQERTLPEHGLQRLHAGLADEFGLKPEEADHIIGRIGMSSEPSPEGAPMAPREAIREHIGAFLEKLESEVGRSLAYSTQEYAEEAVGRLIVHGEGASMPGLAEHICSALELDVRIVVPADVADCPASLSAAAGSPAMITAMGLAQHPGE